MSPDDTAALQRAADALRRGDGAGARALIAPVAERAADQPQIWMMLAEACRIAGDPAGQEAAAAKVIAIEPKAVRAYGWLGDCRRAAGDARGAARWYRDGVRIGAALGDALPAAVAEDLARQRSALSDLEAGFAAQTHAGLAAAGFTDEQMSRRFRESLDLLNGKAELQLQRPGAYYFPGLPQRYFYERTEFDWSGAIEDAMPAIRAELDAALADDTLFSPYLKQDAERPHADFHGMAGNASWSALHLIDNGRVTELAEQRFPATMAAMALAPLCRIGVRAPTIMFSRLAPGARIPPHHGMINARLICHLPLIVPGDGALRVGNETRGWREGELLIFDDSMQHEAWNDAGADRIVLIFDVWRPELTAAECAAVAALFNIIDGPT